MYTSICNASKVRTKIWEMRSSNIYYVNISSFREPIVESIQNLNFTLGIPTTTKKNGMQSKIDTAHRVRIWHVFLQFSSKLLRLFFGESCLMSDFTKNVFEKLREIEIFQRVCWRLSSIFQASHPSQKKCSPKLWSDKERIEFIISFTKKSFKKFWWKLKKWQTFF